MNHIGSYVSRKSVVHILFCWFNMCQDYVYVNGEYKYGHGYYFGNPDDLIFRRLSTTDYDGVLFVFIFISSGQRSDKTWSG